MPDYKTQPRSALAKLCDKCGGMVSPSNSILNLEEAMSGPLIGNVRDRHLFPVPGCEGSPSRVKLIETNSRYARAYKQIKAESN